MIIPPTVHDLQQALQVPMFWVGVVVGVRTVKLLLTILVAARDCRARPHRRASRARD